MPRSFRFVYNMLNESRFNSRLYVDCITLRGQKTYITEVSNDYASNCGPEFVTVHNSLTRAQPCETNGSEILYGDGTIGENSS